MASAAAVSTQADDPLAAARSARLRHVTDDIPGIARRHAASGFDYLDLDGHLIGDFATLSRIKALAVPPAWTAVDLPISGRAHPGDRARRAGTRAVPLSLALARDAGRNQI
jgi:DNA topoisomerase I